MTASRFNIVIPARYASTRLPGKPLLPLAGKPMIAHVCACALRAGATEIVVATDDERIGAAVAELPVKTLLTRAEHNSGSERIAEVVDHYHWPDETIVVNLQGDEPLTPPELVQTLAQALASQTKAQVATLSVPLTDAEEIFNPNVVKTVTDKHGYALYFSRAPVPWDRQYFSALQGQPANPDAYLRHLGLYAYTAGFLRRYVQWESSPLEQIEMLEQLRILWHGEKMLNLVIPSAPQGGVDTPDDLARVERILAQRGEISSGEGCGAQELLGIVVTLLRGLFQPG